MSSPNSKDFFSSFLATADAPDSKQAGSVPADAAIEKILLTFLASQPEPISVKELLGRLELPPSLAMSALTRLSEAQLVDLRRTDNDECAALSDLGRRIAA
jgi:DNA-binding MarR family transcriptional regulator